MAGTAKRVQHQCVYDSGGGPSAYEAGQLPLGPDTRTPSVMSEYTDSDLDVDSQSRSLSRKVTLQASGSESMISDNEISGDNRIYSDDENDVDLAFLGLGDSQHILEAALDEIRQGRIPTYLGPLTTVDKALDVWNDREKLQRASVAL